MNLETYIEKIDAYHEGALTETERLAFESDLESDAELKAAYDLYLQGNEAIEWQIGESLREQMQVWAQEDQRSAAAPKAGKVVAFRQIRWAAAAAVVLLLVLVTAVSVLVARLLLPRCLVFPACSLRWFKIST